MQKDVKELVLTIVKPLVTQPDEVSLELIEGEEFMEYHLKVAEGDIGRIIGKAHLVGLLFLLLIRILLILK